MGKKGKTVTSGSAHNIIYFCKISLYAPYELAFSYSFYTH